MEGSFGERRDDTEWEYVEVKRESSPSEEDLIKATDAFEKEMGWDVPIQVVESSEGQIISLRTQGLLAGDYRLVKSVKTGITQVHTKVGFVNQGEGRDGEVKQVWVKISLRAGVHDGNNGLLEQFFNDIDTNEFPALKMIDEVLNSEKPFLFRLRLKIGDKWLYACPSCLPMNGIDEFLLPQSILDENVLRVTGAYPLDYYTDQRDK